MKKYYDINVLAAAEERLTYIFNTFSHVYFSFSGGKDSGAMVQLADQIAQKSGKKFDLFRHRSQLSLNSELYGIDQTAEKRSTGLSFLLAIL